VTQKVNRNAKQSSVPSNSAYTRRMQQTVECVLFLIITDQLTHSPHYRQNCGCVHSHEISRLQPYLERVCSCTLA